MDLRDEISLGAIYIGTLIGAGFASGQEIISFFTVYGKYGLLGVVVASVLLFLLGYFILRQSILKRSQCVRDIMLPLAGERLALLFDLMTDIFCLAGYYIMLSGCGAVLNECFNLNYMNMIILVSIIIVLCLKKEISGLAEFNKLLVSIILIVTIMIGFACFKDWQGNSYDVNIQFAKRGWLTSSVVYVSYNITLALVVLSSLGTYTNKVSVALGAAAFGASGIMLMGTLMWFITWVNYRWLSSVQIPLLWVARQHGKILYMSSAIVLLSSMLSTALGIGFSFARSLSKRFNIKYRSALNFLFIGIPLTKYSFSGLVNKIYPLFGIIGIFFAVLLVIRRFLSMKIE
ncbi:MAG: hypothetical protein GX892_01215 [Thermoanaerobacteraceae bacterium]|nr:hypothetical protein [Thermoanaerobacteraceae bacterium]